MAFWYIGRLEHYYRIRTENPIEEIWACWLKLTDFHYLQPKWDGADEERMTSVSTYIKQAHEYYRASKVSSLLTRPVLVYYSFLNLAKAFVFLKTDTSPSEYHGLCNFRVSDCLLDISAETNNGVFITMAKTLGQSLDIKISFALKDLVANMIEMAHAYTDYYRRKGCLVTPNVEVYADGNINVVFPANMFPDGKDHFRQLLFERTKLAEDFEEIPIEDESITLKLKAVIPPKTIDKEGTALMRKHFQFSAFQDDNYYLNICPPDKQLLPVLSYFASMFLLSSIVRYHPTHVYRFLNDKNTSVAWFFNILCERSERVFPNLLWNSLNNAVFKFSGTFSL